MSKIHFLIVSTLILFSCSGKEKIPADILTPSKMQAVLWDMIQAGEFLSGFVLVKDSIDRKVENSKMYGRVFQVHQITKETFDKSYGYYRQHPALLKVLLDSLSKKYSNPPYPMTPTADTVQKSPVNITVAD